MEITVEGYIDDLKEIFDLEELNVFQMLDKIASEISLQHACNYNILEQNYTSGNCDYLEVRFYMSPIK